MTEPMAPGTGEPGTAADADGGSDREETPPRNSDQVAVAAEACQMAGGECVARSDCPRDQGSASLPIVCRPGTPGLACCRKAPECPGIETAMCCELDANGAVLRSQRANCDRGYPTCGRSTSTHRLFADLACSMPLTEPTPDSPTRWPGAKSALESVEWACEQLGGYAIQDASCDGYSVSLGIANCCIDPGACPPADPATECCRNDGTVVIKECVNGAAICNQTLVGLGDIREMPVGTCQPFEIMRP